MFGRWITQNDWNPVLNTSSCEDKFQLFITELKQGVDCYLPQRTAKSSPNRKPMDDKSTQDMDHKTQNRIPKTW